MKSTLINERFYGREPGTAGSSADTESRFMRAVARINQELWLVLSLFIIAALFNWLVASHRMILGLYTLPTIFSAYVYGRRHAVLTATASIFIVLILVMTNTGLFAGPAPHVLEFDRWAELITWGCLLLITAYAMGTLYERKEAHVAELRQTYFGLLTILQRLFRTTNTRTTIPIEWRSMPLLWPYAWDLTRNILTICEPRPCCTTWASWKPTGNCCTKRPV